MTVNQPAPAPHIDLATAIIARGLDDAPVAHLVETAMERLVEAGVPLHRMHVGFRILHPLFDGMSVSWTPETGVQVEYFENLDEDNSVYRLSPFYHMLSNGLTELRVRLDRDPRAADFPLLLDLRDRGHTDYLALIVAFGTAPLHPETHDGLGTTWATRDPHGFTDAHIAAMRLVLAPLALALRVVIKDQITKNALNTFHGPLVGGRILAGTIKRGAGERLAAALWYSDLRDSTGLADRLSVEDFLDLLNVYFDCAACAVMEEGGQVLDIIGDAILAFFPTSAFPAEDAGAEDAGAGEACAAALRASRKAHARLAAMKAAGNPRAGSIRFGIGVHFGEMVFGNAGTAERLKFGVIGRAVNEVARTQDMSKALGHPVVVSDAVAARLANGAHGADRVIPAKAGIQPASAEPEAPAPLTDLGRHPLRGIPDPRRLWALDVS